jgi:hypothetical protein
VPELLDAAIDALADTDFPVSVGRTASIVLRLGSEAQVRRLLDRVPDLRRRRFPPFMEGDVAAAWSARFGGEVAAEPAPHERVTPA